MSQPPVLVLDLDGTCIYTDTFHELLGRALSQRPWIIFQTLWWLLIRGRPYTKQRLVEAIYVNPVHLPYNEDFLREAYDHALQGHYMVLATGTHMILAEKIANHLGIFQEVIATENGVNMTGKNKARVLVERFGNNGFIYAGDSRKDGKVWPYASDIWVVNPKLFVTNMAKRLAKHPSNLRLFPLFFSRARCLLKALEPRSWLQNLAFFLPVFFLGIPFKPKLIEAIVMLCLITSGATIFRNILKLENQRQSMDDNPFAKGHLSAVTGLILGPVLLTLGLWFGISINPALVMILVLWSILLIQDDGRISGISRVIGPILIGCFV